MTAHEILQYLNKEAREQTSKWTKLYLTTGETMVGKFFKKYQPVLSSEQNKWIVYLTENPLEPVEVDGSEIKGLVNSSFAEMAMA